MDALLKKYSGRVDDKGFTKLVEEIKNEYLADGISPEEVPLIVGKLMTFTSKLKKVSGAEKKKIVKDTIFFLIEQIDGVPEVDSPMETLLKNLVDPIINGAALLLKTKNCACFK